jgi:CRISPR/Cas system-associated exonuclease Cas4 (RecB family)
LLPGILSIEDFIVQCTGKSTSNEIDLLFILYQAYSETYLPPPEGEVDKEALPTFDKFYAWGQVLLKDFDEVDRYLVNTDELYRNLEQLQELETRYQDNEEVLFALKRFNEMMGNDPTALTASFTNQWARVSKTYHAFKKLLRKHNLYYSGMLYREMAERLQDTSYEFPFSQVVFAGFNALSKSEQVIFTQLRTKGIAQLYWDTDKLYMDNMAEEAGRFMRKNYKHFPPSEQVHWIICDMVKGEKNIQLIGGVQAVGQAQAVAQLLNQISTDQQKNCGVILADEGLLFPVLYALPENTQSLNVTMGYPAKHSHWYRLSTAFLEYQLHQRGKGSSTYIETKYVRTVLSNPLIQNTVPSAKKVLGSINSKIRWLTATELALDESSEILKLVITPRNRVSELINSLVEVLLLIYQKLRLDKNLKGIEAEFAYHSIKLLMQLEERIEKHHQQLEPKTLARLVTHAFEQAKIPFAGEPSHGLQIMGFLETRALDFETVIMVSANEGKLPRGNRHTSYIPFALRKAFKLPTFEEQDAVYAYHFKRLLQRARYINIIYNTEVAIDGSGEKSRFLWQLKQSFPSESIREAVYQMSLPNAVIDTTLKISKSPAVQTRLKQFLVGEEGVKSLSPTAVRHYLDCSLRFYFRYLVRIEEREKESTELDHRDFGNIVHQALEQLYHPLIGGSVDAEQIKNLLDSDSIPGAVSNSIKKHYNTGPKAVLEGKDLLHEQIIQKLIYKAVEADQWAAPFSILGSEMKISSDLGISAGKSVRLEGTLDRVHAVNEVVHIVDYKTGRADLIRKGYFRNNIQAYIQEHFKEPRYKSGFQGFFYGYLWRKHHNNPVKLGVFPLKKVNEGIQWLYNSEIIPVDGFKEFERLLVTTLQELFDESVPFLQTEDADRCKFCAYREICQR